MPVSVVVGGQYGSEGKGKVAHFLAKEMGASVAIRCGGPNSGHTVIDPQGNPLIFRQLPTASILPDVVCVLCAGFYLDPEILSTEIKIAGIDKSRLIIDPHAVIITPEIRETERKGNLMESIGSTGSGTGEAIIRRIKRSADVLFAKDLPELSPYIKDAKQFLRRMLSKGERVILEGTQGYGLSVLHSPHYPYVTSRDTTAAAFVSEAGLSPLDVDDVVLTIRAFPIRVAGNSGPLDDEIDWETVTREGDYPNTIVEKSTVTKRIRRIARFNPDIVRAAIAGNSPTRIVLNHLDYLSAISLQDQKEKSKGFVQRVERSLGHQIDLLGFGPSYTQIHSFREICVEKAYAL